jgi:hypothetical protein
VKGARQTPCLFALDICRRLLGGVINSKARAPLNDAIIVAVARLVDDAQSDRRDPSHSEIEFRIKQAGLTSGDPAAQGLTVGKAKRVRAVLTWGIENAPNDAETLVAALIAHIKGCGGFRKGSPNFVGVEAIEDAAQAFRAAGYVLSSDGDLGPAVIDTLTGSGLTDALEAYIRRARRGSEDAALLVGTGKDLLEATAAHVISERYGSYSSQSNFPTLLGLAFTMLGLATPHTPAQPSDPPQKRLERALYEAGCAVKHSAEQAGNRTWSSVAV